MSADTMSDKDKAEARGTVFHYCGKHNRSVQVSILIYERQPGHGCPECVREQEKEVRQ